MLIWVYKHTQTDKQVRIHAQCGLLKMYYWNRTLCLVSRALGKWQKTLGKPFAECHTRQRGDDKKIMAKQALPIECRFLGTRRSLCRVPVCHSANKSSRHGQPNGGSRFAECLKPNTRQRHLKKIKFLDLPSVFLGTLGKILSLPSVLNRTLDKAIRFA